MKPLLIILILCSCAAARGEELPDAPVPQEHQAKVFSRYNVTAFSVNAALRATDSALSCVQTTRPLHREYMLPSQSCGGIAIMVMAGVPAQIATVALLNHYHHYKMARIALWAFPAADFGSVAFTASHMNSLHRKAINP